LQTENQLRMRGIEDIDLMVTTQATFPADGSGFAQAGQTTGNPFEGFTMPVNVFGGLGNPGKENLAAAPFTQPAGAPAGAYPAGGSATWSGRGMSDLGQRMPATPGIAGSTGHRLPPGGGGGGYGGGGGSRMELQTLLRRTKEASGDVLYVQEQFRFLQQSGQPAGQVHRDERHPPWPSSGGGVGFGVGSSGSNSRLRPHMSLAGGQAATRMVPNFPQHAGHAPAMLMGSRSTSTEEDDWQASHHTLEGMRPLSSDIDATSGGSGNIRH